MSHNNFQCPPRSCIDIAPSCVIHGLSPHEGVRLGPVKPPSKGRHVRPTSVDAADRLPADFLTTGDGQVVIQKDITVLREPQGPHRDRGGSGEPWSVWRACEV